MEMIATIIKKWLCQTIKTRSQFIKNELGEKPQKFKSRVTTFAILKVEKKKFIIFKEEKDSLVIFKARNARSLAKERHGGKWGELASQS